MDCMCVYKNIVSLRKQAGLTQAQVAEKLSVANETVSRLESGKISLTVERLYQLAAMYKCSVIDFFEVEDKDTQYQANRIAALLQSVSPDKRESIVSFVAEAISLLTK